MVYVWLNKYYQALNIFFNFRGWWCGGFCPLGGAWQKIIIIDLVSKHFLNHQATAAAQLYRYGSISELDDIGKKLISDVRRKEQREREKGERFVSSLEVSTVFQYNARQTIIQLQSLILYLQTSWFTTHHKTKQKKKRNITSAVQCLRRMLAAGVMVGGGGSTLWLSKEGTLAYVTRLSKVKWRSAKTKKSFLITRNHRRKNRKKKKKYISSFSEVTLWIQRSKVRGEVRVQIWQHLCLPRYVDEEATVA